MGASGDRGRERPPVSRTRVVASVVVPVVLAAGIGAAVLPRALAARQASDDQAAAALAAATLPSGVLAVLDGGPLEVRAPRPRALPVPAAVTLTVDAVNAVAAAPAADGAAPAAVDTAAAQAEAVAALSSHGVVVTDGSTGIPVTVLAAYRKAEANLAAAKPSCHLPWWVLAGIGRIESGHASGGRVDANGTTRGRIVGIVLDGSVPGTAVIMDTDGGTWDGDPVYDRAVGPMQFLPGSWRAWGKDGNGDGVADPNNVVDAATGAGYLLCSAGDLADPGTLSRAVLAYNHSAAYVASVLRWGAAYRDGVTPSPDSSGQVPAGPVHQAATTPAVAAPAVAATPATTPAATPAATASATSAAQPSTPTTSRTTTPTTTTSAPSTASPTSTRSTPTTSTTSPSSTSTTAPSTPSTTTTAAPTTSASAAASTSPPAPTG